MAVSVTANASAASSLRSIVGRPTQPTSSAKPPSSTACATHAAIPAATAPRGAAQHDPAGTGDAERERGDVPDHGDEGIHQRARPVVAEQDDRVDEPQDKRGQPDDERDDEQLQRARGRVLRGHRGRGARHDAIVQRRPSGYKARRCRGGRARTSSPIATATAAMATAHAAGNT